MPNAGQESQRFFGRKIKHPLKVMLQSSKTTSDMRNPLRIYLKYTDYAQKGFRVLAVFFVL